MSARNGILPVAPAAGPKPCGRGLRAHHLRRPAADLQGVPVHEGEQVVQPVVAAGGRRFPVRALGQLPVPQGRVHPGARAVHAQTHGHPGSDRQAVTQGSGAGLEPGKPVHVRVAGHPAFQHPVGVEELQVEEASLREHRVQAQALVPGGENEAVTPLPRRIGGIDLHDPGSRERSGCRQPKGHRPGGRTGPPRTSAGRSSGRAGPSSSAPRSQARQGRSLSSRSAARP